MRFAIRAHQRQAQAVLRERAQHRAGSFEQRDLSDLFGLQPPHVPRDPG
jgi:hypothetical protein